MWPERVVDRLEVVDVEDEHDHVRAGAARPVECRDQPLPQERAVREVGEQVVRRPVAVGRRLPPAEIDREHRQEAERYQRDGRARRADDDGSQREHEAAGDDVEREVLEQVAPDGLVVEHRAPRSRQHLVGDEEGGRAGGDRGERPGTHLDRGGRAREAQGDAGDTDRQDVLRRVEHEVRRAGAQHEVREDRRHGVHGHRRRHAEDEQDRHRVRGGHRHVVVPVAAGHEQRQQLAHEDEQREQPERGRAGSRRPCGARRSDSQGRDRPDARQRRVAQEGGRLAHGHRALTHRRRGPPVSGSCGPCPRWPAAAGNPAGPSPGCPAPCP